MSGLGWAILSALWFGILTSISPCPLATNITAISFVGRRTGSARDVLLSGLPYTLGRAVVYTAIGVLLVMSLLSALMVSLTLQTSMNKILGPILILSGMVMLGLVRFNLRGREINDGLRQRVERWGLMGALVLGCLFALSFCPVSATLFFGSLLPLSVQHPSGVLLPFVYGIGTAVPVVIFVLILTFGAQGLGRALRRVTQIEQWMRWITGVIFIGVGVYMSLMFVCRIL